MQDIRTLRLGREMTQETLADLLNISQGHLARLESMRRDITPKIQARVDSIFHNPSQPMPFPESPAKEILCDLNAAHLKESIDYLESYLKDCRGQLHKFEKLIRLNKNKYTGAIIDMMVTEGYTAGIKKAKNEELILRDIEERKYSLSVSKSTLQQILRQEPEITIIKIDGLKEEIRKLKPMIAAKKKQLKKKDFTSQQLPGLAEIPHTKDVAKSTISVNSPSQKNENGTTQKLTLNEGSSQPTITDDEDISADKTSEYQTDNDQKTA